jgi:cytochrome P450
MELATLHRDADRHRYFAEHAAQAIFFDKSVSCWFVTDPKDTRVLLQSPNLTVPSYTPIYDKPEIRSRHPFTHLRFAFAHIPNSSDGDHHRLHRRSLAAFLVQRRAAVAPLLPEFVGRRLAPLQRPGEVELMADVLVPLVSDVIGAVTEVEIEDDGTAQSVSMIFDRLIGLRTRIHLDNDLGRIREMIHRSRPGLSEEEEGLRLSLFIFGHDTLTGTLGESLYQLIRLNEGRRLNEIEYPPMPPETSVPFLERLVKQAFEYSGISFAEDQRIRLSLQAMAYSPNAEDRDRIFGIGMHTCLGRQLALDTWKQVVNRLSQLPLRTRVSLHKIRTTDYFFTVPQAVVIKLDE